MNFNPFRGYSPAERDIRDPDGPRADQGHRQLEGAIIIRRDGVAVAACHAHRRAGQGLHAEQGAGHAARGGRRHQQEHQGHRRHGQPIVRHVRLFQNGEVVLHIEPLARPMIWGRFHMEARDPNGINRIVAGRALPVADNNYVVRIGPHGERGAQPSDCGNTGDETPRFPPRAGNRD